MPDETWTYDELFGDLDPAPSFVAELERLRMLRVVGRDATGAKLYDGTAREQLESVLGLVELGYQPRDIAAIAQRVGLPKGKRRLFRRTPIYLRLQELARRAGVSPEEVQALVAAGVVEAKVSTEGGEALFATRAVRLVRHCGDLSRFGLRTQDILYWTQLDARLVALGGADEVESDAEGEDVEADEDITMVAPGATIVDAATDLPAMLESITELEARLRDLRSGVRRWDKRLAGLRKRVDRAARANDVTLDAGLRKRRRRRRILRRRLATARPSPPQAALLTSAGNPPAPADSEDSGDSEDSAN